MKTTKTLSEDKTVKKKLDYYLNLPYSIKIRPEVGGGYFAEVVELPGCMTEGETYEETWNLIHEAMEGWLELSIEKGHEIPLPESMKEHSGKFIIRIPKYLHRKLAKEAEKEGISLNQFISSLLSEKITLLEVKRELEEFLSEFKKNKNFFWNVPIGYHH